MHAETMEGALDKNDFMDVFYNTFIEKLIAPVGGDPADTNSSSNNSKAKAGAAAGGSGSRGAAGAAALGKDGSGSSSSSGGGSMSDVPASTIGLIVDLLCFCVQHHAFWAKYHVLR